MEVDTVMGRPSEVLGEALGPIAIAQDFKSCEVIAVERLHRPDRQTDTMNRQRVTFAQRGELRVGRPSSPHIVLGVDLEESDWLRCGDDVGKMRWLEADAGTRRKVCNNGHSLVFNLALHSDITENA